MDNRKQIKELLNEIESKILVNILSLDKLVFPLLGKTSEELHTNDKKKLDKEFKIIFNSEDGPKILFLMSYDNFLKEQELAWNGIYDELSKEKGGEYE